MEHNCYSLGIILRWIPSLPGRDILKVPAILKSTNRMVIRFKNKQKNLQDFENKAQL
jgi:hypothetical protein